MEFLLVFWIFPFAVLVTSAVGFLLVRNWFVMPLVTLAVFTILTITVFNQTFVIWDVLYTLLSLLVSWVMKRGIRKS